MDGTFLPEIRVAPPGPVSVAQVSRLARTECPAITARRSRRATETGVPQDPIVWADAKGSNVRDVDGNIYVDFTSAFGVCGLGHGHPAVVQAVKDQADKLIHAMGDVYPSDVKIDLCDRLVEVTPEGLERSILGLSGASSIESALKTAAIHTGKPGVISFDGGYHGLSIGALSVTAYKESFRAPFLGMLNTHNATLPFPESPEEAEAAVHGLRELLAIRSDVGAVLLEPIQARGGTRVPPAGFLRDVRSVCTELGVVMILDEIYTGFARTGHMFACEADEVVPDVLCIGKAMGGGFPISAAIGRAEVMDSWGASQGEAIHTQTFLGSPLGCAMALAAIDALVDDLWADRVQERGGVLLAKLVDAGFKVRGRGLMLGVELADVRTSLIVMDALRATGYLVLPCGQAGDVLAVTPPFVVTDAQMDGFVAALQIAVENARQPG